MSTTIIINNITNVYNINCHIQNWINLNKTCEICETPNKYGFQPGQLICPHSNRVFEWKNLCLSCAPQIRNLKLSKDDSFDLQQSKNIGKTILSICTKPEQLPNMMCLVGYHEGTTTPKLVHVSILEKEKFLNSIAQNYIV